MEVKVFQILLQILLPVLYPDAEHRAPLVLLGGRGGVMQQLRIAEKVFELGVPVTVLREDQHSSDQILGTIERDFNLKILVDFDALRDVELFAEMAHRKLLSTKRQYFIVGSSMDDFKEAIETVPVFIDAALRFIEVNATNALIYSIANPAQPYGGRFHYHIEQEYTINDDRLQMRVPFGRAPDPSWSSVSLPVGIVSLSCENSSVVTDEFMTWYESEWDQSVDASPRLGFSVFRAIQEALGFKTSFVCAQYWSVKSDSGGAVGDLVAGNTVLSTAPMLALESRRKLLDIVFPVKHFQSTFTFQTPKLNDLTGSAFLKPFSLTLWLCLVLAILLVGIAMKKMIQLEIRTGYLCETYAFEPAFSLTILSTLGVLCQQGMPFVLKWNTSRVLQVTFFLCGVIFYNYYTSLVVSDLISFPKATKLNSLKALLESNLELGAQNISYVHYYMKESDLKHVRDLYQKMVSTKEQYFFSPAEGTAKARRSGFAYHCESRTTLRLMMKTYDFFELCNYHEIPLIKDAIFTVATKHSPLTELFRMQYMRTAELGLIAKKDKIFGEPLITCLSNALIEEVNIKYIAPILLLLLYVAILSTVILVIEILWDKVSRNNNFYAK